MTARAQRAAARLLWLALAAALAHGAASASPHCSAWVRAWRARTHMPAGKDPPARRLGSCRQLPPRPRIERDPSGKRCANAGRIAQTPCLRGRSGMRAAFWVQLPGGLRPLPGACLCIRRARARAGPPTHAARARVSQALHHTAYAEAATHNLTRFKAELLGKAVDLKFNTTFDLPGNASWCARWSPAAAPSPISPEAFATPKPPCSRKRLCSALLCHPVHTQPQTRSAAGRGPR